ncbi:DUF29 family protein [Argonema galeatum]|uniref:DUF29 family protein n=1 Tax=Argonema galeatum TaxID=2942762 RepID=UPI0020115C07|nr:DUF29 family protein [Argonema galeatum]MCL1464053.1 DUF29 domain-containing protein [Argonema galeatum A003/A1]
MTQELIDLRASILEGRYEDALAIVDELDWMSKKGTLRYIKSFLLRMLIHLIKNQLEQRLTNSWAASIRGSIIEIKDLNLQDNKTSYYVKQNEWDTMLENTLEQAIRDASVEVFNGNYTSFQLSEMVDRNRVIITAKSLLYLTYYHSIKELAAVVDDYLTQLPGGEDWQFGRQR